MKNILCIILAFLLSFNNICVIYADDHTSSSGENHGGSSGTFEDYGDLPVNYKPMTNEQQRIFDILGAMIAPGAVVVKNLATDIYESFKGDVMDKNEDSIKQGMLEDGAISRDKNYIYINQNFVKNINQQLQDSVHALDGYWLIEPANKYTPQYIYMQTGATETKLANLKDRLSKYNTYFWIYGIDTSYYWHCYKIEDEKYLYFDTSNSYFTYYDKEANDWHSSSKNHFWYSSSASAGVVDYSYSYFPNAKYKQAEMLEKFVTNSYGNSFKVFYSKQDVMNYILKGESRTYAPKLPNVSIKIPVNYVTNNTNLPDINFGNLSLSGKAEANIQAELDAVLKLYLDKLAEIDVNPSVPTPTPTPIISDGQPTPTPGFTDGSLTPTPPPTNVDLTDTNNWLEKIYNWLEAFGKSHDKFTKDLSDYLETHRGKLEDIIKALDKIADGMEKGEDDGCKYDYSELSDFMKELWNESDKKFDTMIDLLETNNEYQKKLVKSLNDIKAILVTQTVLELFQNRSEETANQAKEKFPTSLPWDIAMILNAMSAEPKALKVELPIKIESFKINESITVDLTGKEWEQLATTCRYLLSITFILYLIHLSRKLFFKGDDD